MPLTPAFAESPRAEAAAPTRVYIETDTKALGERGNGMQGALYRELRAAFEASGVELVEADQNDPDAVRLRIRFSGNAEDVYLFKYELHFELINGKTATQLIEPVACPECFDPALYETLNQQVPALIEAIEAEAVSDTEGNDVTPPSGDGDGDVSDPPIAPKPKPIGPLGGVGIGVAALGLGATIGGAVELSRGKVYDEPSKQPAERTFVDHTLPGGVLIGVGAAGLTVGTAMLIADVVIRAKRRKQHQTRGAYPLISPGVAGIGYVQRF
jgi:hypothetical protein